MANYRNANGKGCLLLLILLSIQPLIILSGCSSYVARSVRIKESLREGDYQEAISNIEKIDQKRSPLLYYYEKGLILHFQADYEASNEAFEAAEFLIEELYTKSVTRELAALTITDNIAKYRGDPFEAAFINYYKILNYLHIDDIEGALIESRKVNQKLQVIHDSGETYYENDPFLQYLTGMVYQLASDYTESEVSFRVAIDAFNELHTTYGTDIPDHLYCDAAATARHLSDIESTRQFGSMADCPSIGTISDLGIVNIFLECGYLPHKVEENIVLPIFTRDNIDEADFARTLAGRRGVSYHDGVKIEYLLRIAFPVLESTPIPYDYAIIRPVPVSTGAESTIELSTTRTVLVDDFDTLAKKSYQEKEKTLLLRTIIRALAKYGAKRATSEKNEGLGILVNVFNVASESADTRSWSTLPEKVLMGRLYLPEGMYDLEIDFYEFDGRKSDSFDIKGVEMQKGGTLFLNHRFF